MASAAQSRIANRNIGDAEWQARQELAACYRIFDHMGWTESVYNHITVKVPGEEGAFLINPFGLLFGEVTASNLVKIDIDGNVLDDSPYPVNQAGFVQHSMFHRSLPDAHAVIHTHTTATMAVCSNEEGLLPINFYACNFAGRIAWHEFEGVTVRDDEGARLIESLGDRRVLMLRNHGPVVIGPTLPIAFLQYWALQRACEIQIAALSMGLTPARVGEDVIAVHQRDVGSVRAGVEPGRADFDAWVRRIDRIDPSWRD